MQSFLVELKDFYEKTVVKINYQSRKISSKLSDISIDQFQGGAEMEGRDASEIKMFCVWVTNIQESKIKNVPRRKCWEKNFIEVDKV